MKCFSQKHQFLPDFCNTNFIYIDIKTIFCFHLLTHREKIIWAGTFHLALNFHL